MSHEASKQHRGRSTHDLAGGAAPEAEAPAARRKVRRMSKALYEVELFRLQGELVEMQEWVRTTGARLVVVFEGRDVMELSDAEMRALRGRRIAMVFQEPMSALNPVFTVCAQISDALRTRGILAPAGSFYAYEAFRALDTGVDRGLRIGVAAYTDDGDVDRLLMALDELA